MSQRRRQRIKKTFFHEYTSHLMQTVAHTGKMLSKNYILVGQDVDRYPKPDEIIALTSSVRPRFWYATPDDFQDDLLDSSAGIIPKMERSFDSYPPSYNDGVNDLRYFAVVDHIDSDGNIVIYDDLDKKHTFTDKQVQVVDLYLYPSSSYESTFKVGYDYANNPLAIKADIAFNDHEQVCKIISESPTIMFERCLLSIQRDAMDRISTEYSNRGMVIKKQVPIIRVRLESCIFIGKTIDTEPTPYVVEALRHLKDMGYHIDIVSDEYPKWQSDFKDVESKLSQLGIKYNTYNAMYKFDFIVDTRNAMNYGNINWTQVFYNITGTPLLTLLENETDKNAPLLGDLENKTEQMFEFSGEYSDLLEITEEAFNELKEQNVLHDLYPLAPVEWSVVKLLQDTYRGGMPYTSCTSDYQELIDVLGLKEFFEDSDDE